MKKLFAILMLCVSLCAYAQSRIDVIPTDRLSYTVYKANPWSGRPAPTVMMGHGCGGIVQVQTRDFVQDLTQWGYNVVVVDSWGPRNIRSVCRWWQPPYYHPPVRMTEFYEIAEKIIQENWHNGRLGYIGFSHGGSLGLSLAGEGRMFDAVVSYYPACGRNAFNSREMLIPTQMHISYGDTWTPASQCESVSGSVERIVHQNATHAWDIRAPDRIYMGEFLSYNSHADSVSRNAMRKFFEQHLK